MPEPDAGELLGVRARGCLLGGAIGDALGAPVEFWSLAEIRERCGEDGVKGYLNARGEVTDDTQMTLFTAEGLIRAEVRRRSRGICHVPSVVHHAYLRWLHTQGVSWAEAGAAIGEGAPDGWLVGEARLHRRRAPGSTCLGALGSGVQGSVEEPLNDSKGCGGVMRAAPAGLIADSSQRAFELGCEVAAITHGHPTGWLAAGALAAMVFELAAGASIPEALEASQGQLAQRSHHEETSGALERAWQVAEQGRPNPEDLERLGGGWVAEEALAIAVCCALAIPDPRAAVLALVNHSGDSDSTGSICGNIVGTAHGEGWWPAPWVDELDTADLVRQIADDLCAERLSSPATSTDEWRTRYPGW